MSRQEPASPQIMQVTGYSAIVQEANLGNTGNYGTIYQRKTSAPLPRTNPRNDELIYPLPQTHEMDELANQ